MLKVNNGHRVSYFGLVQLSHFESATITARWVNII